MFRRKPIGAAVLAVLAAAPLARAIILPEVNPVSLDQPRINAAVFPTLDAPDPLGDPDLGYTIQAFFDTGASGVLMSSDTWGALGLTPTPHINGPDGKAEFHDVGVGGSEAFWVSAPQYIGLADFPGNSDDVGNVPVGDFVRGPSPVRLQMQKPPDVPDPFGPLVAGLDVFGMPLMQNKVVVLDPTPVDSAAQGFDLLGALLDPNNPPALDPNAGYMVTRVHQPGDAAIPPTSHQVRLSYADFARFTQMLPGDADPPGMFFNPFIGPSPAPLPGDAPDPSPPPGVKVGRGAASATGSFLVDTGAGVSMVSENLALALGVKYDDLRQQLVDAVTLAPLDRQFAITLGGVGGTVKALGFYLDYLVLPTTAGDPGNYDDPAHLRFVSAPVLVHNISLQDPTNQQILTLDGILGMNFLVGSGYLDENELGFDPYSFFDDWDFANPDDLLDWLDRIANADPLDDPLGYLDLLTQLLNVVDLLAGLDPREGLFDAIVFDQPGALLGLNLKPQYVPEPATAAILLLGAVPLVLRRRRP